MARVSGRSISISTKAAIEIATFVRGKRIDSAISYLQQVIEKKKAIPYKRSTEAGHRRGQIAAGKYPLIASQEILKLLNGLKKDAKAFKKQWSLLALLTKDVIDSRKMKKKYSTFYKTVLYDVNDCDKLLVTFRRRGLKTMNTGSCLEVVINIWKKQNYIAIICLTFVISS